jgi:response regulator RpfG family c-di-GMP phosphodiesterase
MVLRCILKEIFYRVCGFISNAVIVAMVNHANCDGTNYPNDMKALDIPLVAGLISLADMFE